METEENFTGFSYNPTSEAENNDTQKLSRGAFLAARGTVRLRKHKKKHSKIKIHSKLKRKLSKFERKYTELGDDLIPEKTVIDYVLVHPTRSSLKTDDKKKIAEFEERERVREIFEEELVDEGITLETEEHPDVIFKLLHCPFKRLCAEAEKVKLEMPLKGCKNYTDTPSRVRDFIDEYFETDKEVDFVSAPFLMDRIHLYEKYENPTIFFRQAQRSLLTYHILINSDIKGKLDYQRESMKKPGLLYMMMEEIYTDAFVPHEESNRSEEKEEIKHNPETTPRKLSEKRLQNDPPCDDDPRGIMDDHWTIFWKFQPLWMIRNYFGEKIALYFAWTGMLTTSLWLPTLFGVIIFSYGLSLSIERMAETNTNSTVVANATLAQEIQLAVTNLLDVIKESFDNEVTPFFAFVICLWGTVFLELWKRKNATLAYEWDVEDFELNEPDRPEFYGTKVKKDPVTEDDNWFYPVKRQLMKFFLSTSSLLFMVFLVIISVGGVIVYRVMISVDYCPGMNSTECILTTTIVSSLLNAISILILGKVYSMLARVLTDWENHRTQTQFDDALIVKLFAFQFANSYASCFYIAFFQGRFNYMSWFGFGEEYADDCNGSCMSQLSFQVLILMLIKPFPKLIQDIILPWLIKLFRPIKCACCSGCCCCRKNQVDEESLQPVHSDSGENNYTFLEKEKLKPPLEDFTLEEYTEKIIQYGFLMLFAASFPLAPLLALLTNLFDIRVDAKRLLWWYRRPVAFISQDIGMWYGILNFVNLCGVVSNGFLIAFTSTWGQQYDSMSQLWIVIAFEHVVFLLKFVLAYLIPDVPAEVDLAIRRERFQITKKLDEGSTPSGSLGFGTLVLEGEVEQNKRKSRSGGPGGGEKTASEVIRNEQGETKSESVSRNSSQNQAKTQDQDTAKQQLTSTLRKVSLPELTIPEKIQLPPLDERDTETMVVEKRKPRKRRSRKNKELTGQDNTGYVFGLQLGSRRPHSQGPLVGQKIRVATSDEPGDSEL
ncbi:hypothetical protein ScPMuIL_009930 [Solemya velum]